MKHLLLLTLAIFAFANVAHANLLVSPTRVVFEGKDRTQSLIIVNTSSQTRSYRMEWVENTVDEYGKYTRIPEGEVTFAASQFLRYSPRQVSLAPGERQTIKLMLRRNNTMVLPEYRSHLQLTALAPRTESDSDAPVTPGIGFKINVATSYVVPVMLRTQVIQADIDISSIELLVKPDGSADIQVDLVKEGAGSINGDINVYMMQANDDEKLIGTLKGLNIFHESNGVKARLKWQNFSGAVEGILRAEFVGQAEFAGKTFDVVEKNITLNDYSK